MKKKLTARQIVLLLCLINVAVFSLSYQFIYDKYHKLAADMKMQTELTNQQIAQRDYELEQEEVTKQETAEMNSQCEEIISSFPVYIAKEDNLVFIEKMEKALSVNIPYMDVTDSTEVYTTILPIRNEEGEEIISAAGNSEAAATQTAGTVDTAGDAAADGDVEGTTSDTVTEEGIVSDEETGDSQSAAVDGTAAQAEASGQQYMKGLQSSITINFQTTYKEFKELVDYIEQYPELSSVANANLSYDASTGSIMAGLTINRYALTGTGKVYEEPYIGDISIGKENIFGTGTK